MVGCDLHRSGKARQAQMLFQMKLFVEKRDSAQRLWQPYRASPFSESMHKPDIGVTQRRYMHLCKSVQKASTGAYYTK